MADLARGFQAARVLLTAVRIDLFSKLDNASLGIDDLAARLGADVRAVAGLTNALAQLGILERDGGRYRNSAAAARYLSRSSADARVDVFLYTDNLWPEWSRLTPMLLGEVAPQHAAWDDAAMRSYVRAMHQGKPDAGRQLVQRLDLRGDEIVADLGGGPGTIGEAFAEHLPEGRVVLADRAVALDEARQRLPASLLEAGRIRLVEADLLEANLRKLAAPAAGFDVAVLSSVTHLLGPEENGRLLSAVRAALTPGGRLVIRDFITDGDSTAPLDAAMLSLTMLVTTPRGRCYSLAEYRAMLADAGFAESETRDLDGGATLIAARGV